MRYCFSLFLKGLRSIGSCDMDVDNGSFKIKAVVTTREYKKAMKSLRNLKSIINTERFSNLNIRIKEQTRKMRLREISIDFHEKIVTDDNTPQMNVTKDRLTSSLIE